MDIMVDGTNAIKTTLWQETKTDTAKETKTKSKIDYSQATDEDLMLACQKDKYEALEELYKRYHRPVMMFILRIVQNRDLAEDLIQETFLRVYNNRQIGRRHNQGCD